MAFARLSNVLESNFSARVDTAYESVQSRKLAPIATDDNFAKNTQNRLHVNTSSVAP